MILGPSLGTESFVESLERLLACSLEPKKLQPKTRERDRCTGDLFSEGNRIEQAVPVEIGDAPQITDRD
jgi:hypothetical protein